MNILVVEDHPDLRQALEEELKEDSYEVDSCDNGNCALEKMMNQEYDAIILDITLPNIDGFHLLKHFRDAGKSTPVIMLTAQTNVDTKVASLNVGADDYLTKPFEYVELSARLRALLRRKTTEFEKMIKIGKVVVFPHSKRVTAAGKVVQNRRAL